MSESTPFFSICVPTRNRPETLFSCLKTLLHQNFESYEIILSDNCDQLESIATKKLVEDLNSPKIKYHKPDAVLSMAKNYEFAISKAQGKYIVCIGDDDGLIIDSLQYVHDFIERYGARIVKSPVTWYHWINSLDHPNSIMLLPFARPVTITDSKSILTKVAQFELGYFNLPMIYYSFVLKQIVDEVVAEHGTFFQDAASIDMYSGFIIAYSTDHFYVADKPFIIAGQSGKSNGASTGNNVENTVAKEFFKQHNLVEVYKKYQVPLLPKYDLSTFVLLEMTKFVSNFHITPAELKLNVRKVMLNFLATQPVVEKVESIPMLEYFREYPVYREDISFIEKNYLGKQVYMPFLGNNDVQLIPGGEVIDPHLFGIKDVYDASVIFAKLINSRENLEPIYFNSQLQQDLLPKKEQNQLPFIRRAINRLKMSVKVLIHGSLN